MNKNTLYIDRGDDGFFYYKRINEKSNTILYYPSIHFDLSKIEYISVYNPKTNQPRVFNRTHVGRNHYTYRCGKDMFLYVVVRGGNNDTGVDLTSICRMMGIEVEVEKQREKIKR